MPAAAARLLDARWPEVAALRAVYAGRPEHPVLIERELFGRLGAPGDQSPEQILKAAGVELVTCDDLGMSVEIDILAQPKGLLAARLGRLGPADRGGVGRLANVAVEAAERLGVGEELGDGAAPHVRRLADRGASCDTRTLRVIRYPARGERSLPAKADAGRESRRSADR